MASAGEIKLSVDTTNLRMLGNADWMFGLLHRIAYGPEPDPEWVKTSAREIVDRIIGRSSHSFGERDT